MSVMIMLLPAFIFFIKYINFSDIYEYPWTYVNFFIYIGAKYLHSW